MINFNGRLDTILQSWAKTPYFHGGNIKQGGTDCFQFIVAVVQELHGLDLSKEPVNPLDSGLHNPELGMRAIIRAVSRYPFEIVKRADPIVTAMGCGVPSPQFEFLPGDIGCCRTATGITITHGFIVAEDARMAWHSTLRTGVVKTSVQAMRSTTDKILRINYDGLLHR